MIKEIKLDALTNLHEYAYALGHLINDLTETLWFGFILIYLTNINPIDDKNPEFYSGLVMISGEIADALITPFTGYFSDKTKTRFGRRMPWYMAGLVI